MSAAVGVANFTFHDRSVFFELPDGPVDPVNGLPTVVLPVGAVVYRADHGGAKEPSGDVPAFFTNVNSTRAYTRGAKGTKSSYVVKKEARLFHMNLNSLMALARHVASTGGDTDVFDHYLAMTEDEYGERFFVNPSDFLEANLKEYREGKVSHPNYLNRRLAQIVCSLGFDGWVVKPFDVEKKTGLEQLSKVLAMKIQIAREKVDELLPAFQAEKNPAKKAELGAEIKPLLELASAIPIVQYTPEIMLCSWKTHMDVKALPVANKNGAAAGAGGKARLRRNRKTRR